MYPVIMNWGCFIYRMLVPLDSMSGSDPAFLLFPDALHWTGCGLIEVETAKVWNPG